MTHATARNAGRIVGMVLYEAGIEIALGLATTATAGAASPAIAARLVILTKKLEKFGDVGKWVIKELQPGGVIYKKIDELIEAIRARRKAGGGWDWPKINEVVDPSVIRQLTENACGPASATMLLKEKGVVVFQSNIAALKREVASSARSLAAAMNSLMNRHGLAAAGKWVGDSLAVTIDTLQKLINTGPFIATLKAPGTGLHMVVVDGLDSFGRVIIRDPWEGTRYLMNTSDFLAHWTPQVVYWKKT